MYRLHNGWTAFVAEIEDHFLTSIQDKVRKKGLRFATSEELIDLHNRVYRLSEEGSALECTVALGSKDSSGKYTFVRNGLVDRTLTGIDEHNIQPGHRVLLIDEEEKVED